MRKSPDLLNATWWINLDDIRECLRIDPECIRQVDAYGHNAMHLCVGGGTHRMRHIMEFFIQETDIDLLHENYEHRDGTAGSYSSAQMAVLHGVTDLDADELLTNGNLIRGVIVVAAPGRYMRPLPLHRGQVRKPIPFGLPTNVHGNSLKGLSAGPVGGMNSMPLAYMMSVLR